MHVSIFDKINILNLPGDSPSGQQPYSVIEQHPRLSGPEAGVFPSSQQPNSPFAQSADSDVGSVVVIVSGHPFFAGPLASVSLSAQQPYLNKIKKKFIKNI